MTTTLPLDLGAYTGLPAIPEAAVAHGEVFTRTWVVEAILDLVGWQPDEDLTRLRLVEPACGAGAFLGPVARRVSESCRKHDQGLAAAAGCVRAMDLLPANVAASQQVVASTLAADGWDPPAAHEIAHSWVSQGDYLLSQPDQVEVDVVVGNPPYIRLEDLPDQRMQVYRSLWPTMVGRADVYVGFIEAGIRSLREGGRLGFICADRWMRNQYGRALRALVAQRFAVDVVIGMHDVDAFEDQVSAYPAIMVLRRGAPGQTVVADASDRFDAVGAGELVRFARRGLGSQASGRGWQGARVRSWPARPRAERADGAGAPWPAASPAVTAALTDLSRRFPTLGEPASGVRVGIGVATGADSIFITQDRDLVEEDRLLPLAMARDTATGTFRWSGHYLVNPWSPAGQLVTLTEYPRLRQYLTNHSGQLGGRHVARRQPAKWFRTIDKVDHTLVDRPKLLFPDMKAASHPVLEPGSRYPHHNLYWLTSDDWDLEVLGGLLLSRVAEAFVAAYGVRMRGGTLRFQAQYLRMIPVPPPATVAPAAAAALRDAFRDRDAAAATERALTVYGLTRWPE